MCMYANFDCQITLSNELTDGVTANFEFHAASRQITRRKNFQCYYEKYLNLKI